MAEEIRRSPPFECFWCHGKSWGYIYQPQPGEWVFTPDFVHEASTAIMSFTRVCNTPCETSILSMACRTFLLVKAASPWKLSSQKLQGALEAEQKLMQTHLWHLNCFRSDFQSSLWFRFQFMMLKFQRRSWRQQNKHTLEYECLASTVRALQNGQNITFYTILVNGKLSVQFVDTESIDRHVFQDICLL